MAAKVAVVRQGPDIRASFSHAVNLIGGIGGLNSAAREVVIKVGVFDPKHGRYPTIPVTQTIIDCFSATSRIYLAESDNYRGSGSERLQIWQKLFSDRVRPFNLTEDPNMQRVEIAGEEMELSHILFKPNVLVSTHVLRKYKQGTVLKNLFGLISFKKKARLHKKLAPVLMDLYEAVGGVDLAVVDATYTFSGNPKRKGIRTNLLIISHDAVAVDTVCAKLTGIKPDQVPVLQEAQIRGIGESNLDCIEILGEPLDSIAKEITGLIRASKRKPINNATKKKC
jgi:uncharacterized protein (DUF362 family)